MMTPLLVALPTSTPSKAFYAAETVDRVVGVVDGDTITVLDATKE